MERVYTWVGVDGRPNGSGGGSGNWYDPANWLYAEYNGPGLYDPQVNHSALVNIRVATQAPGATDTVAFGFFGGQVFGGGSAARLVATPDSAPFVLADNINDGRTDVYSFGSVALHDRQLQVVGAALVSKTTEIDVTSRLFLSSAGTATDQWGRAYSADLGALTLDTEFHPNGTYSGSVIAGTRTVEIDSLIGNAAVRTDSYNPASQTPYGGLYSAAGAGYLLDPKAAPGFMLSGAVHQGNAWTLDLHVAQGDTGSSLMLGGINIGTGGNLSYSITDFSYDSSWNLSSLAGPRTPLWPGVSNADLAARYNADTAGVHTLTAVMHSYDATPNVGGHAILADQTLTIRLTVDPAPIVTLKALSSNAAGSEGTPNVKGGGEVAFMATLDIPSISAQTVQWHVALVGGNTATPGDFLGGVLPSGTLTFAPGETSRMISVRTAQDAVIEPDETFVIEMVGPSAGLRLGSGRLFGTILNDDAPPKPFVSLAVDRPGQFEGKPGETTAYTFTAKLSAAAATQQSVHWAVSGGALNPTDAADFTGATSGSLVFDAGETQKAVTVRVAGDAAVELDETFIVALSAETSGIDVRPQTYALATVLTDDKVEPTQPPPPPVHVSDAQIAAYAEMAGRMFQGMLAVQGDGFWQH